MDQFVCLLHRRPRARISGAVLLADRHQRMEVVDEALRDFWRQRDRPIRRHWSYGEIDGDEFGIYGQVQFVTSRAKARWLTDGFAAIHLQSSVRVVALAEQCVARVCRFLHPAVAVSDVAALPKERHHQDLKMATDFTDKHRSRKSRGLNICENLCLSVA